MNQEDNIGLQKIDSTCMQLILRPEKDTKIYSSCKISLWVQKHWWDRKVKNNDDLPKIGSMFSIFLEEVDLRIRNIPFYSTLTVLGNKVEIAQNSPRLSLNINATIRVDYIKDTRLEATIITGAITLQNLKNSLYSTDLSWLWKRKDEIVKSLILGAHDCQILVGSATATKNNLYQFLCHTHDGAGILWKMIYCEKQTNIFSPDEIMECHLNKIKDIAHKTKAINIVEQVRQAGVYAVIRKQNGTYIFNEYYKPGIEVRFLDEKSQNITTTWKPQELRVQDYYELIDFSEIDALLSTGISHESEFIPDLSALWKISTPSDHREGFSPSAPSTVVRTIARSDESNDNSAYIFPPMYLLGVDLPGVIQDDYIWQMTKICNSINESESSFAPSWLRHHLNPLSTQALKDSDGTTNWINNIKGKEITFVGLSTNIQDPNPWIIKFNIPRRSNDTADRIRLRFTTGVHSDSVQLSVRLPEIKLVSPPKIFSTQPMLNAACIPYNKRISDKLRLASFIFSNCTSDTGAKALSAVLNTKGILEFESNDDTTLAFLHPEQFALIDNVSSTGPNLDIVLHKSAVVMRRPVKISLSKEYFNNLHAPLTVTSQSDSFMPIKYAEFGVAIPVAADINQVIVRKIDVGEITDSPNSLVIKITPVQAWPTAFLKLLENGDLAVDNFEICLVQLTHDRDPNHGLVPVQVNSFTMDFSDASNLLKIHLKDVDADNNHDSIPGMAVTSADALFPWAESTITTLKHRPIQFVRTKQAVHHRNLVLEHAEYEVSFEQNTHTDPSVNISSASFQRAVRDEFTLAIENALSTGEVQFMNWLPNANISGKNQNGGEVKIAPSIEYYDPIINYRSNHELPELLIKWAETSRSLESTFSLKTQILSVQDSDNWLNYDVFPSINETGVTLNLSEITEGSYAANYYRTINSSAPLMFINYNNKEKSYTHSYDNLGVLRENTHRVCTNTVPPMLIRMVKAKARQYRSLSVDHLILANNRGQIPVENPAVSYLTQIIFFCDSLIIDESGMLFAENTSGCPFDLGVFSFYSKIETPRLEGAGNQSMLRKVDHWPRYLGIPFFVTSIEKIEIASENQNTIFKSMEFNAVLINPDAILHEYNIDEDRDTYLPEFIKQAVAEKNVVKFKWSHGDVSTIDILRDPNIEEDSKINWYLDVESQNTEEGVISGKLANIYARVSVNDKKDQPKITIDLDPKNSNALILGRLWRLEKNISDTSSPQSLIQLAGKGEFNNIQILRRATVLSDTRLKLLDESTMTDPGAYVGYFVEIKGPDNNYVPVGFVQCYSGLQNENTENLSYELILSQRQSFNSGAIIDCRLIMYTQTNVRFENINAKTCRLAITDNKKKFKIVNSQDIKPIAKLIKGQSVRILVRSKKDNKIIEKMYENIDITDFIVVGNDPHQDYFILIKNEILVENIIDITLFLSGALSLSTIDKLRYEYLPVKEFALEKATPFNENIFAIIKQGTLSLYLGEVILNSEINQGIYYGFKNDIDKTRMALILWLENDSNLSNDRQYYLNCFIIKTSYETRILNLMGGQPVQVRNLSGECSRCDIYTYKQEIIGESNIRVWHQSETISGIFKSPKPTNNEYQITLYFDDQIIFDGYHKPDGAIVNQSRSVYVMAALSVQDSLEIQVPLRINFTENSRNCFEVEKNYYYVKPVVHRDSQNEIKPTPDINIGNINIWMRDMKQADLQNMHHGFAKLYYDGQFKIVAVNDAEIPLKLCLEPDAISNLTKQSDYVLRTAHRQGYGTRARLNFSNYQSLLNQQSEEDNLNNFIFDSTNKYWLLSPIMGPSSKQGRMMLFEDNIIYRNNYLVDGGSAPVGERGGVQTENLLVFNRPIQQSVYSDNKLYSCLLSTTNQFDPNRSEYNKFLNSEQMQRRLLESGAAGIALHHTMYQICNGQKCDYEVKYQFINSPFYMEGYEHQSEFEYLFKRSISRFAFSSLDSAAPRVDVDRRAINPRVIIRYVKLQDQDHYIANRPEDDPYRSKPCTPFRALRLTRKALEHEKMKLDVQQRQNRYYLPDHWQPLVHIHDAVAFKEREIMWNVPVDEHRVNMLSKKLSKHNDFFLPNVLDIQYGSDKAGAVFLHELKNIVAHQSPAKSRTVWTLSPPVTFAIREPNHIKVKGCVMNKIETVQASCQVNKVLLSNVFDIAVTWKDVIGEIDLKDKLASELKVDPSSVIQKKSILEFEFKRTDNNSRNTNTLEPLYLIAQHNDSLMAITNDMAALPAYDINETYVWPNLYITVSNSIRDWKFTLRKDEIPIEIYDLLYNREPLDIEFKPYLVLNHGKIQEISADNTGKCILKIENSKLEKGNEIFIPGLKAVEGLLANENCRVVKTEGSLITTNCTNVDPPQSPEYYQLIALETIANAGNRTSSTHYSTYTLHLGNELLHKNMVFQIIWIGSVKVKRSTGDYTYQKAFVKAYQFDKLVKFLMPSVVIPKIAGILRMKNNTGYQYQRNIFFGSAVPACEGKVEFDDQATGHVFRYYVNDEESVSVPLANAYRPDVFSTGTNASITVSVMKYLTHGQVIYGSGNLTR